MEVPYGEGVASHTGPESCVYIRKGIGEALTGEVRAGLLSRERYCKTLGCRRCPQKRKATPVASLPRDVAGPCVVKDPVHVRKLLTREPGGPTFDLRCFAEVRAVNPEGARQR